MRNIHENIGICYLAVGLHGREELHDLFAPRIFQPPFAYNIGSHPFTQYIRYY